MGLGMGMEHKQGWGPEALSASQNAVGCMEPPPRQGTVCSDPQNQASGSLLVFTVWLSQRSLSCSCHPLLFLSLLPSSSGCPCPVSLLTTVSPLCPSLGCFLKLRRELGGLWRAHLDTLRGDPPLLCGLRQMSSPLCACSLCLAIGALGPSCRPVLCLGLTRKPPNQMSKSSFQALL